MHSVQRMFCFVLHWLLKQPKFLKVGTAGPAAMGLLVVALQLSGEPRLGKAAVDLYAHLPASLEASPSAAGFLAAELAKQSLRRKDGIAGAARANELYFDPATGTYQASPAKLPMGIALRVPASGDTPSAEVLALRAGVDAQTADLIRRGLLSAIEYDDLPPGDVLLGLATK